VSRTLDTVSETRGQVLPRLSEQGRVVLGGHPILQRALLPEPGGGDFCGVHKRRLVRRGHFVPDGDRGVPFQTRERKCAAGIGG